MDRTNVVGVGARFAARRQRDPRRLMEQAYEAGSVPVAAEDGATRLVARLLCAMGLLDVCEVAGDGSLKPLSGAALRASAAPWRVSRPQTGAPVLAGSGLAALSP